MTNIYVLDTNVLLHDPKSPFAFKENDVVIPLAVIEEIDNQKKRQDEIGRNARIVSKLLDEIRTNGDISEGIPLHHGGRLIVEVNHEKFLDFPQELDPHKYDNRILALTMNLMTEERGNVILVTKDLNLRIKADVMGIRAEDFSNDKVDYLELYRGQREIHVSGEDLDSFFQNRWLEWKQEPLPYPNEFVVIKNSAKNSQSALSRYLDHALHPLTHEKSSNWGIKARNKEQKFTMELLLDHTIQVITLVGSAGTGKTLLALAAGLEHVIEQHRYNRLLIIRPIVPMGDDLGYLPGSKEENIRHWMQPIYDNLEYLFRDGDTSFDLLDDFIDRGVIEMDTLTYIRNYYVFESIFFITSYCWILDQQNS